MACVHPIQKTPVLKKWTRVKYRAWKHDAGFHYNAAIQCTVTGTFR